MNRLSISLKQTPLSNVAHIVAPFILCVLLILFQYKALQDDRQSYLDQAQLNAHDLGSTLGLSIAASFENIDLTLQAAIDHIQLAQSAQEMDGNSINFTLLKLQSRVPSLARISAIDETGHILFLSQGDKSELPALGERDYFLELKKNLQTGMVISRPMINQVTKKWEIICARRINRQNGDFGGIVVASVELEGYLNRLYGSEIKLSGDDMFVLRDDDGSTIIRYAKGKQEMDVMSVKVNPDNSTLSGKAHTSNANNAGSAAGSAAGSTAVDRIERIYYYQRIGNRPMNLVVGISVQDALVMWQSESKKAWIETYSLIAVIIIAAYVINRSRQRQLSAFSEIQKIQLKLEQSNKELAKLSTTDGLTGLANRRRFDEVAPHEWQRAMRKREPLAIAMIDVDFFKIYNDKYGHQAGDQALTVIADTLAKGLRDGSDFIARYGGEEFVILLPGQNAKGAYEVLERLREDIEALAIPHLGSDINAVITISAGFASFVPRPNVSLDNLIELADQSLYAAKRKGKNRVVGLSGSRLMLNPRARNQVYGI